MNDLKNVFDVGARAMSAQMVRINTVASNLANAGTVASTAEGAFRALRPVFETTFSDASDSLATTDATGVVMLDRQPERLFRPDDPAADKDGFVYAAAVNPEEEMVEMTEASRQYQNTLEAMSTLRALMARTVQMGQ
ncbi:flagellar basal body rod protein FlgC [Paragemmobacter straminiformis]|uniref:Flagellar basal-body rod protein FlgC n=1 Tax=Paragemmobacter straminiformis TaxID=2045119 RepID=A0A842I4I9_9RHOB|nr:flagellar basal body rod protein FlgC [Gemmobacter straminiformis]MBC2834750.1 flagellar basal body rod protein FlgC [Gemmobacter straminiformis]